MEKSKWPIAGMPRNRLDSASVEAFTSAATQLQRECPMTWDSSHKVELNDCPVCHGTGFVGPTAVELAEALKDGLLAEMLVCVETLHGDVNKFSYPTTQHKGIMTELMTKLEGKEG